MTGIASQPFWLYWAGDTGGRVSHAPDYFARRADGSAVVVDCRPAERRKPRDIERFEATARACELAGWEYRLAGAADPVVTANLRWLAAYRHPRHRVPATAGQDMSFPRRGVGVQVIMSDRVSASRSICRGGLPWPQTAVNSGSGG